MVETQFDLSGVFAEAEGAEESVPERKTAGVVRVGLGLVPGMVHVVHARGHDEPAQGTIEWGGNAEVAVVEEDDGKGDRFVEKKMRNCQTEEREDEQTGKEGEDDLEGVKANAGTGIEFGIGVVDGMEAPEEGKTMIEAMPPVLPAVEEDKAEDPVQGGGKREEGEQAQVVRACEVGDREQRESESEGEGGIDRGEPEVCGVVGETPTTRREHGRE